VSLAGDVVLLSDSFGVACLSSSGTRVLASAPFPGASWSSNGLSWGAFGAIGRDVYAVESSPTNSAAERIVTVALPPTCWSR
jgi:hypothetical protein